MAFSGIEQPQRVNAGRPEMAKLLGFCGEPVGIRTRDLLIKSQLLYRLSYGLGRPNSLKERGRAGQSHDYRVVSIRPPWPLFVNGYN